ncbi:nucleoside recognition domain-containing protein [Metabacillus rhizolycopersici]|uniref:50S ribosome-binding GTPase n=1 Tax=Metabacillus rhizolycopersici TaxID=2875709 RepID=A0ABS7USV0_9BACI|nr:nucleoside recognition domain-containing protein [Metabacillus rhizolycopersici]MBZ5751112.1 50S ribosome-binding GTPase [Metabacillus rhizolycopersici]
MLAATLSTDRTALIGLESSGKTTIFSRLGGRDIGSKTNVKGATYTTYTQYVDGFLVVDTPGIRSIDTASNEIAKREIEKSNRIMLVVRGTHFKEEISQLLPLVENTNKAVIIIATYADKMTVKSKQILAKQIIKYKLPLFLLDARNLTSQNSNQILEECDEQQSLTPKQYQSLISIDIDQIEPKGLIFDHPTVGGIFSVLSLISMFLLPVVIAHWVSNFIQPFIESLILYPLIQFFENSPSLLNSLFVGDYGILTLGIYSFIWAFPVVLLIGLSTAIVDETGLKDRIIDSLDPYLKKLGLEGRDLMPVLSGFGCNVVAVFQSRSCSSCTRKQCVSLITFGSACSYQIGATLSIFNSANKTWMFLPYIVVLLLGSIMHTKLWSKKNNHSHYFGLTPRRTFLQKPTFKGSTFRLKSDIKQFITQAMPIFISICAIAALLEYFKIIHYASFIFKPLLQLLQLPVEAASGLAFSIIRKDGMLIFNEGNGALLSSLTNLQLFLLIFLASTMTACIVTMLTVGKEFGSKQAFQMIFQQGVTSIICTLFIALSMKCIQFIL